MKRDDKQIVTVVLSSKWGRARDARMRNLIDTCGVPPMPSAPRR